MSHSAAVAHKISLWPTWFTIYTHTNIQAIKKEPSLTKIERMTLKLTQFFHMCQF